MATTTLVTFLVRVPIEIISVSLYGSWDNFTTPYPMHRDARIGPEHWSGCHNFSNIICDGSLDRDQRPRQGGLKMGGTYWYYYKLDDDLEFHNSSEPSTTVCPMLPGQLVNILHVPFAFSSSRSRSASADSTCSDRRTMNPDDKFMNPRPVPKPRLPRLNTSPTTTQNQWSRHTFPRSTQSDRAVTSGPSSSLPSSASTLRLMTLSRKQSFESSSRQVSPVGSLSHGIKHAFRSLRTPKSGGSDVLHPAEIPLSSDSCVSWRPSTTEAPSWDRPSTKVAPDHVSEGPCRKELVSDEPVPGSLSFTSFQQHRRQRSRSRDQSSLRRSLTIGEDNHVDSVDIIPLRIQPLDTLKEINSAQNTPGLPLTATKVPLTDAQSEDRSRIDLEKRLPTLPNSPSSAYPASAATEASCARRLSAELLQLESHFSATTIDTDESIHSCSTADCTHFSNWSSHYSRMSATSLQSAWNTMDSTVAADAHPATNAFHPYEVNKMDINKARHISLQEGVTNRVSQLTPAFSSSNISSTTTSSLSSSPRTSMLTDVYMDSNPKHYGSIDERYQHYSLPQDNYSHDLSKGQPTANNIGNRLEHLLPAALNVRHSQTINNFPREHPQSNNMQQLLQDLSYLGGLIHTN